ncbi:non-ribosomal peptide synthetase [Dactylosporangium sp. CA-139114]|uniref:non-ribosomal peptide synthetase n=1 Tax=Dactylosporangium sp. CA-139114 TaxID=3239931 RepID=UPI003D972DAE
MKTSATQTITALFAESVHRHADRPAVSDDAGRRLTYAELDRASARLARTLVRVGVGREERVGVHRQRDVDLVIGILAALRAGAAYTAVDLRYPKARRDLMLHAAGARVTLVGADERDAPGPGIATLACGHESGEPADEPAPLPVAAGEDAACVLFTSGSTGTPKGVVVEHRNLVHFALNPVLPQIVAGDRVAQVANVSFDTFHYELWCAFAAGAELVMMPSVPDLVQRDPERELHRRRISVLLAPTMAFNSIAVEDAGVFAGLRLLLTGGDVIRPSACREVLDSAFEGRLTNLYGPTEATTAVTAHDITAVAPDAVSVPIGRALDGAALYVLDAAMDPVAPGTPGELYIGGAATTRGYLGDPARTAERFLPDPFGEPGSVMYRTGDVVTRDADGVVEYLGRNDNQVKIRGYRVEPREVERSLMARAGVVDAAVLPQGEGQDRRLVAFVVLCGELTLPELRGHAEEHLPDYQVPAEFVQVEEIPATPHGKRDAAALLTLLADRDRNRTDYVAPHTDSERYLARAWQELLGAEWISTGDDFFAMGGNSMLAFRLSRRVARELAPGITLEEVLKNTVMRDMALAVDAALGKAETA